MNNKDYNVIEYIGHGSNGNKVYTVKHNISNNIYAMKAIHVNNASSSKFSNEINILKSLDNSYVIKYIDSFTDNKDTVYIIMEYAEGKDLNEYIKNFKENYNNSKNNINNNNSYNTKIPELKIWKWLIQLLYAIKYIHSNKILHRDIKVHNAFLTNNEDIKLGDFGVAKLLECTIDYANSTLGTPYYLSPEICSGESYNFKTDIWMLGCLVYELCTFERPFNGENIPIIINNIKNKNVKKINQDGFYSKELIEIIYLMLDKNQSSRPSAIELLNLKAVQNKINNLEHNTNNNIYCNQVDNTRKININCNSNNSYSLLSKSFGEKKYLKINIKDNDNNYEKESNLIHNNLYNCIDNSNNYYNQLNYKKKYLNNNINHHVTPNYTKEYVNKIQKNMDISPIAANNSSNKVFSVKCSNYYNNNNNINNNMNNSNYANINNSQSNLYNSGSKIKSLVIKHYNNNNNNSNNKAKNQLYFKGFGSASKSKVLDNIYYYNYDDYQTTSTAKDSSVGLGTPQSMFEPSPINNVYIKKNKVICNNNFGGIPLSREKMLNNSKDEDNIYHNQNKVEIYGKENTSFKMFNNIVNNSKNVEITSYEESSLNNNNINNNNINNNQSYNNNNNKPHNKHIVNKNNSISAIKRNIHIKNNNRGRIKHISMDISSTIISPSDNLKLDIKVEGLKNIQFKNNYSNYSMAAINNNKNNYLSNNYDNSFLSSIKSKSINKTTKQLSKQKSMISLKSYCYNRIKKNK